MRQVMHICFKEAFRNCPGFIQYEELLTQILLNLTILFSKTQQIKECAIGAVYCDNQSTDEERGTPAKSYYSNTLYSTFSRH